MLMTSHHFSSLMSHDANYKNATMPTTNNNAKVFSRAAFGNFLPHSGTQTFCPPPSLCEQQSRMLGEHRQRSRTHALLNGTVRTFSVVVVVSEFCHGRNVVDRKESHVRVPHILQLGEDRLLDAVRRATVVQEAPKVTVPAEQW